MQCLMILQQLGYFQISKILFFLKSIHTLDQTYMFVIINRNIKIMNNYISTKQVAFLFNCYHFELKIRLGLLTSNLVSSINMVRFLIITFLVLALVSIYLKIPCKITINKC